MLQLQLIQKTKPIRILILELVKEGIANHTGEIVLNVQNIRKNVKEHSVRARLSEAVLKKELIRLKTGVYDIYREEEINSVVDYPSRGPWGSCKYRGNISGFLIKDLIYHFRPKRVLDPMEGSGTTRDVIDGLRKHKGMKIEYMGLDLKKGFDLLNDEIKGEYDLIILHSPYFNMIKYSDNKNDLSNCKDYDDFKSKLKKCIKKLHKVLSEDGALAVIIGDLRKNGSYTPIFNDIINFKIGRLRSVIIKKQNNVKSSHRIYSKKKFLIPIVHEYGLLFSKY